MSSRAASVSLLLLNLRQQARDLLNLFTITICDVAQLEAENEVNNEMANRMSLFYAEATPMLKTLSNATTKFVSEVEVV